ncbi:MAG: hypothetical protein HY372_01825 [Candidatus Andersenbacteria bacterium]|nr:hypothetical protein [Candidatus Andersenbacteria bacterium]
MTRYQLRRIELLEERVTLAADIQSLISAAAAAADVRRDHWQSAWHVDGYESRFPLSRQIDAAGSFEEVHPEVIHTQRTGAGDMSV